MNINQLICFISVANNNSFSRAAIELNWSQPAISKAIKDLETELNAKLFDRTTRSVRLTKNGKYFYGIAKNVVLSLQIAKDNLNSPTGISLKEINIGYLNTYADKIFMPMLIRKLRSTYPKSNIHIVETFFDNMQAALNDGNLTFTFCEEDNVKNNPNLLFYPILKSGYCIVMSPNDKLATKDSITLNDLVDRKIIFGNIKNYLPIEQHLHDKIINKVSVYNTSEATDMMIMGILVKSENKLGLLPEYGIDKNDPSLVSIPLKDSPHTLWGFTVSKNFFGEKDIINLTKALKQVYASFAEINIFECSTLIN